MLWHDSCTKLDVRLLLKTTDGVFIVMSYHVLRHGPQALMQALDRCEAADPASYYFRLSGLFETSAGSIVSLPSASATDTLTDRSTTSSKFSDRLWQGARNARCPALFSAAGPVRD
jgi:hypothetical protein